MQFFQIWLASNACQTSLFFRGPPANMAEIPGISVPSGFSDGMPVGLQLLAKAFDEGNLCGIAHAYEKAAKVYQKMAQV